MQIRQVFTQSILKECNKNGLDASHNLKLCEDSNQYNISSLEYGLNASDMSCRMYGVVDYIEADTSSLPSDMQPLLQQSSYSDLYTDLADSREQDPAFSFFNQKANEGSYLQKNMDVSASTIFNSELADLYHESEIYEDSKQIGQVELLEYTHSRNRKIEDDHQQLVHERVQEQPLPLSQHYPSFTQAYLQSSSSDLQQNSAWDTMTALQQQPFPLQLINYDRQYEVDQQTESDQIQTLDILEIHTQEYLQLQLDHYDNFQSFDRGRAVAPMEAFEKFGITDFGQVQTQLLHSSKCVVCQEEYYQSDQVIQLPCSHLFHTQCIKQWVVQQSKRCPLCGYECCKETVYKYD